MDKVVAILLGILLVVLVAGSVLFDKVYPDMENRGDTIMTELHL